MIEPVNFLRGFLGTYPGFLFAPVEDRDGEIDGHPRVLGRVVVNVSEIVVVADESERKRYVALKFIQRLGTYHLKVEIRTFNFALTEFQP